jgi:3D (Asp-Asp-Asp) domain-containing protein
MRRPMLDDLVNPTTNLPPTTTILAKLARRALVAVSLIIGVGLAGVVFARGTVARQNSVVWVVRGHPVVVHAPSEAKHPAMPVTFAASKQDDELLRDVDAQLAKASIAKPQAAVPQINSKHVVMMEVTAYCPCTKCCGPEAQGLTASGKPVSYNDGRFVAADRKFAFGTKLSIPGYGDGRAVEVIDRGGAIKGERLDVFFPTHAEALQWGRQKVAVTVED